MQLGGPRRKRAPEVSLRKERRGDWRQAGLPAAGFFGTVAIG